MRKKLEHFLHNRQHCCIMLPKFHCELNSIERCWGQSKRYTRVYTNYTFPNLRKNIPLALDTVTIENIKKYFRKARQNNLESSVQCLKDMEGIGPLHKSISITTDIVCLSDMSRESSVVSRRVF